jgi:hypothetical protein
MKHTVWRNITAFFLLIMLYGVCVHAEETSPKLDIFKVYLVRYTVVDMLGQTRKPDEIRRVKLPINSHEQFYILEKINVETGRVLSVSRKEPLREKILFANVPYYQDENVEAYTPISNTQATTFGRIELKDITTNKIYDAFALFITHEQEGVVVTLTKTFIVPGIGKFIITKIYHEDIDFFPTYEREEHFTESGEKNFDQLYTAQ